MNLDAHKFQFYLYTQNNALGALIFVILKAVIFATKVALENICLGEGGGMVVCLFVVYLTTLFQYLRLYSVDF
jgi:hypothetical protein